MSTPLAEVEEVKLKEEEAPGYVAPLKPYNPKKEKVVVDEIIELVAEVKQEKTEVNKAAKTTAKVKKTAKKVVKSQKTTKKKKK